MRALAPAAGLDRDQAHALGHPRRRGGAVAGDGGNAHARLSRRGGVAVIHQPQPRPGLIDGKEGRRPGQDQPDEEGAEDNEAGGPSGHGGCADPFCSDL